MRIFAAILFCSLAILPLPARAADPSQVFSTILGEIGRQIEQQERQKRYKGLQPLWEACDKGDVAACDRAAQFPGLHPQVRAAIGRMRQAAERHQAFVRDFQACQRMDSDACQKALTYPSLALADRVRLLDWKHNADQHDYALAEFHRNQRACHSGSIAACSAAIDARRLDPAAVPELERQRARLQQAEQERQAALARRQRAEEQRQAAERQRQASIREYEGLRTDCADGKRTACTRAASHAQVHPSDLAYLKKRNRELAPLTERVTSFFAEIKPADAGSSKPSTPALFGVLALCAAGLYFVVRKRTPALPAGRELPSLAPQVSAEQPTEPSTALSFPLTGHMPTDVRRALVAANT